MFKKANIDSRIIDVIDREEYIKNMSQYSNNVTGIEKNGIVYPLRGKNDTRPGVYNCGPMTQYIHPAEEESKNYSSSNIINFYDVNSVEDIMRKQDEFRGSEKSVLTTVDNICVPYIGPDDYPATRGFKESIISKNMDIEKYEHRFDNPSAFNNDKRLLNKENITLGKIVSMSNKFDLEIEMIFRDKGPDVANPMGREISVILTGRGDDDE